MISIVMAYKNRREQLIRTLHTISKSTEKDLEVIIVDDDSDEDEKVFDLITMFDLDISTYEITTRQRQWRNPCVPFNMGFDKACGDIVIMQSPECLHVGDVLSYVKANTNSERYICFSCYAIAEKNMKKFVPIDFRQNANQLQQSLINACGGLEAMNKQRILNGNLWYCHPEFRSWAPHFTSAIKRKTLLEEFGGFDERYKNGCDYDDMEFYHRIKRSNVNVIIPDPREAPFVIHQYHTSTNKVEDRELEQTNSKLFYDITQKESGWKVN